MWEQKPEEKPKCVKACGHHEKETIYIDYYVKAKIDALMKKYNDIEWLGYFVGDKENNIVKDMFIPPQRVTATSVTEIETPADVTIMGVVHSHHKLGLQDFSGIDHAYINDNHDLSVLVWHGGIKAQKKTQLPCGSVFISDVSIEFFHENINLGDLEKESDENITEGYNYNNNLTNWPLPAVGPGPYIPAAGWRQHWHEDNGHEPGCLSPAVIQPHKKKDSNGKNSKNSAKKTWDTGVRVQKSDNPDYNKYLDAMVYGDEMYIDFYEEYLGEGGIELAPDHDVEAHFRRIEENECGVKKIKQPVRKVPLWS